jgi:outer membrane receptor for ferrienterochelin and colicin
MALFLCGTTAAQKVTISGYVQDASNGESLIGASVYAVRLQKGAVANNYGFYSLTLKPDSISLSFSYVGYRSQTVHLFLTRDTVIIMKLQNSALLGEVIVTEDKADKIQESTRMGTISLPISQIKAMPALMGETDVIKALQLLPGVQGGSEGSSGLYVRGGGADQNLILLDGVPVYNASHLYGFFSTFNADAINHVELVKGGFPARYGGRLSSVVDIRMKEGDESKLHGQVSLGVISSKFVLEGPIGNKKTSFIISGRRSYLNLLDASVFKSQPAPDDYYFYDLNAKINHQINKKNRIYLSAYMGADHANSEKDESYIVPPVSYFSKSISKLSWGNKIAALRWNHVFSPRLFSNVTATYSHYQLQVRNQTNSETTGPAPGEVKDEFYNYNYRSGIQDFATRIDFDFIPNPNNYIRFGAQAIDHNFTPGVLALSSTDSITTATLAANNTRAKEVSVYVEDDFVISSQLKINAGLHASAFLLTGRNYSSLQPRLSARFLASPEWSLKASYSSMQQYIHLLTNAGIGLPTDLWVPATASIRPQTSNQFALGMARTFQKEFEISVEAYYKTMNHVIEYKDGATYLSVDKDWQTKVEAGKGESHGAELLVQKKTGKWNGLLGYTLSWTNRQFDNLNGGKWFPYRYDRRHDAKIALTYTRNDHWQYGMIWIFGTGNAVTIPLEKYQPVDGQGPTAAYFESRNNFRMKSYHRLDLNVSYVVRRKTVEHRLTFSVYNAYNRKNPFYLTFGYEDNREVLKQVSLFGVLPSITYSIKF